MLMMDLFERAVKSIKKNPALRRDRAEAGMSTALLKKLKDNLDTPNDIAKLRKFQ
jgi:hypothetical protein